MAVPVRALYRAFAPRARKAWLGDAKLAVRKATPNKSMRIAFGDGTPVDVTFLAKGAGKSLVHIEHRRLPSQAEAARLRAFWAERLAALAAHLAVQPTR